MRAPRPRAHELRAAFARLAATSASGLSRTLGVGGGSAIGGRVLLRVDPEALGRLSRTRRIAVVTGTNGKTTTTHLLATALRTREPVASNTEGANMPPGLAWALLREPGAPAAVLEVDELYLPRVVEATGPAVVLLLNVSRDQLDRSSEVHNIARRWRTALGGRDDLTVVANADDPGVAWAASAAPRVVWVAPGRHWRDDTAICPSCGTLLSEDDEKWWCTGCGLARPDPDYAVDAGGDPPAIVVPGGRRLPAALALPGTVNVGNAAFALAGAGLLGVPADAALAAVAEVREAAGRYHTATYAGHERLLVLAKNPAGWQEGLGLLPEGAPVIVAINAREADGRDPSWLWDVPFEMLRGRRVVATGERASDLAVRLLYADVPHDLVPDLASALAHVDGFAALIANYTAFQQARRIVDGPQRRIPLSRGARTQDRNLS